MKDADHPGDAPVELSPSKRAMITEAIREILAGTRRRPDTERRARSQPPTEGSGRTETINEDRQPR